jgi:hypothetical protein
MWQVSRLLKFEAEDQPCGALVQTAHVKSPKSRFHYQRLGVLIPVGPPITCNMTSHNYVLKRLSKSKIAKRVYLPISRDSSRIRIADP